MALSVEVSDFSDRPRKSVQGPKGCSRTLSAAAPDAPHLAIAPTYLAGNLSGEGPAVCNGAAINPAKQAKAAETPAMGAEFGALVSQIAHDRNAARKAARHPAETPPAPATPPAGSTTESGTGETIDVSV